MTTKNNETTVSQCHDPEMEQALLGSMILFNWRVPEILQILETPDVFFESKNQDVYRAIRDLAENRAPIEEATVHVKLRETGFLKKYEAWTYVYDLVEKAGAGPTEYYAKKVIERANLRKIANFSAQIIKSVESMDTSSEQLAEQIKTGVYQLHKESGTLKVTKVKDMVVDTMERWESYQSGEYMRDVVTTGLLDIDRIIGGMAQKRLYVLGGHTSHGKTQFAIQVALRTAQKNRPVLFFSLEMSKDEIMDRLISARSRVPTTKAIQKNLTDSDWQMVGLAASEIRELPIEIHEEAAIRLDKMQSIAKAFSVGKETGLIVVDYLQLMKPQKSGNREQEVSSISRGLKQIAMETGLPVLALSQLRRFHSEDKQREPRLSDLRESGAIEQDAHVVMFAYHEASKASKKWILIAKNRSGPLGRVQLAFVDGRWETIDQNPREDLPF